MIQDIQIGDKTYPLSISLNTLAEFGRLTGRNTSQTLNISQENTGLDDFLVLIWCAFKDGARLRKTEFNLTKEDIGDLMNDNPSAFAGFIAAYSESMPPPSDDKKKEQANP